MLQMTTSIGLGNTDFGKIYFQRTIQTVKDK